MAKKFIAPVDLNDNKLLNVAQGTDDSDGVNLGQTFWRRNAAGDVYNINPTGYVGVGTNDPANNFEVVNNFGHKVQVGYAGSSGASGINFLAGVADGFRIRYFSSDIFQIQGIGTSKGYTLRNSGANIVSTEGGVSIGHPSTVYAGRLFWLDNNTEQKAVVFSASSSNGFADFLINLDNTGELHLPKYGSGIFAGTIAKILAVNASGDVIEVNLDDLSPFQRTGTDVTLVNTNDNVGIGISPTAKLHLLAAAEELQIDANLFESIVALSMKASGTMTLGTENGSLISYGNLHQFKTGTLERMRINSTGNVSIGYTGDFGYKFHLLQSASGQKALMVAISNGTAEVVRIVKGASNMLCISTDQTIDQVELGHKSANVEVSILPSQNNHREKRIYAHGNGYGSNHIDGHLYRRENAAWISTQATDTTNTIHIELDQGSVLGRCIIEFDGMLENGYFLARYQIDLNNVTISPLGAVQIPAGTTIIVYSNGSGNIVVRISRVSGTVGESCFSVATQRGSTSATGSSFAPAVAGVTFQTLTS